MSARARTAARPDTCPGFVSLVGAGPGDPELLTLRAVQRLREADIVLYDGLVPAAVVRLAARARRVSVARRVGPKTLTQDAVSARLVAEAWKGRRVVRLKAGDPFVFARGGEEARELAAARVPFEIVPGVSSALAAPALAGIPVTHRGMSSAFVVVTGHSETAYAPVLGRLAPDSATVIVLMGQAERAGIRRVLLDAGWSADTSVAIVARASQPGQTTWIGTLDTLATARPVRPKAPGVIVIGPVVRQAVQGFGAAGRGATHLTLPFVSEETPWQPLTIPRR